MSLLDVWVEPAYALVGVDSEIVINGDIRSERSKLLAIPHLNAVMACRGSVIFFNILFSRIATEFSVIDDIEQAIGCTLSQTFDLYNKAMDGRGLGDDSSRLSQHGVLVGWSRERRKIIGVSYELNDVDEGFKVSPFGEVHQYVAPALGGSHDSTLHRDRDSMYRIGILQAKLLQADFPAVAGGGRFLLAKVSENEVSISDLGPLPMRISS